MNPEQLAFKAYVEAIGRTVGHFASAREARKACPAEYNAWREAFKTLYGSDPS